MNEVVDDLTILHDQTIETKLSQVQTKNQT
jgi:hypothetical protein